MENRRRLFMGSRNEDKTAIAIGGAIVIGIATYPVIPLLGISSIGLGVGGLAIDIITKMNNKSANSSDVSLIEKIFFDTGLVKLVEVDKKGVPKYSIPEVLGVRDENGTRIVDLQVPIGFSLKELNQRCYFALKDYFKCKEVDFKSKGEGLYEMILKYEEDKVRELSVWDSFWLASGIYGGEKTNPVFPKLLKAGDIQGGVRYMFLLPLGKSTHHLSKMDTTIKEFLNARYVTIDHVKGSPDGIIIKIDAYMLDVPEKVPFKLDGDKEKGLFKLLLGESLFGDVFIDMVKTPHLLLAGATNTGKSVMLKAILMYLFCNYSTDELEVYLADLKRTELMRFKGLKHVKRCVHSIDDTTDMLKGIMSECNRRLELFENGGFKSDIVEYNNSVTKNEKLPYMFVVIEEYVRYTSGGGKDVNSRQDRLNELLCICRAAGIYVCLTVQRPTKSTLNEGIKSNIGNIIGLKTVNSENSKVICENTDLLKNLRGKGHGYLFSGVDTTEYQGMWLSNDDIERLIVEHKLSK